MPRNRAIYRRSIDRCNAHDFGSLGAFVAADVRVNGLVVGLDGDIRGPDNGVASFPDSHWRLDHLVGEGEWLSARFTDSGTQRGVFLGVAPTGR